jgi:hypothetical protein
MPWTSPQKVNSAANQNVVQARAAHITMEPFSSKTEILRFLYSYRNAAHSATGKSPAKILLGRELRLKLDLLRPHTRKRKEVPARFEEGQEVLARDYRPGQGKWHKGIVERRIGTYLYLVRAENRNLKRHVDQLLPLKEGSVGQTEEEEELSSTNMGGSGPFLNGGGGGQPGGPNIIKKSEFLLNTILVYWSTIRAIKQQQF